MPAKPLSACRQMAAEQDSVPSLTVPTRLAAATSVGFSLEGLGHALTHRELEFIAEEEPVVIVPAFTSPRLQLLGGEVGPFRAQASLPRRC